MKRRLKLLSILLVCLSVISLVPNAFAAVQGDVDGDGDVTVKDARAVLRFASFIDKPSSAEKKAADMDGDGVVTLKDVKLILSSAANILPFREKMLELGFPVSYVEHLEELHAKYPQWEFEPFITNLDWQAAVNGERKTHRQQLIENVVQSSYKCSCSKCNGVIQESPNWVSASEEAVKYYMDPRNFLTEDYIFQFESTAYDSSHTIEGVEIIFEGTWMHDAYITYLDGNGATKTFTKNGKKVKYSEAIMTAAKDSGMSAYYLASKIVQEVGSSSASNAGGASGKCSPYNGIYNYYNIGAYTGVMDGLKWANGNMKTTRSVVMYKTASVSGEQVVTIPNGTEVYYISTSGDFYKVSVIVGGKTYKGFVVKENIYSTLSNGRPWDNPYKTIYYGAKFICDGYLEHQFTGYLQKFNVNPNSDELHGHEYVANVRAAASEAKHTYSAYVDAGILGAKKVFSIPVFKNMPYADLTKGDAFKQAKTTISCSEYSSDSITLKWDAIPYAEKYQIFKYNPDAGAYERITTVTGLSYTDSDLSAGKTAKYKIRAYYKTADGDAVYSSYSAVFSGALAPSKPTGLSVASKTETSVKLKWTAVSGAGVYVVYRYDAISGSYENVGTAETNTFTDSTVSSGTAYKYKLRAGIKTSSKTFYSGYSSPVSVTTAGESVIKSGTVKIIDGYLNLRSSASTSAESIAQLSNGQAVTILGSSGDWFKVTVDLNGKTYTGYAHSDYITVGAAVTPTVEKCPYSEPTSTVRQGDSGDSVKWVQWYLYKIGYLEKSDIDGSFGPTTLAAVIAFQEDEGLDADGLVGAMSRAALISAYGE